MTKAEILAVISDRDVVALTILHEAAASVTGRVSVGAVIATRVRDGRYGKGWRGVCLKPWQFSCWRVEGGAVNHQRLLATAERIATGDFGVWKGVGLQMCAEIADALMLADGATHYLTTALYQTKPPTWTRGKVPRGTLAGHVFFAGVDG